MSAIASTTEAGPLTAATAHGRVTFPNVIGSEWTKLVSLRSTRWTLLTACVAMAGLGPLVASRRWSRRRRRVVRR